MANLNATTRVRHETRDGAEVVAPGSLAKASGGILELLDRTDRLMNEVQTLLRRIGVELERLGIPPWELPPSSRPLARPELDSLSPRESEIVKLLVAGDRVSTIARNLFISQHTVRNHLQSVYRKVGVGSQAELIEWLKEAARPRPSSAELLHCG